MNLAIRVVLCLSLFLLQVHGLLSFRLASNATDFAHLSKEEADGTVSGGTARRQIHWEGVTLSAIAGGSTMIGGLVIAPFPNAPPSSLMAFGLSLAAGVMLTVSVCIIIEAGHGIWWYYLLCVAGMCMTYFLGKVATYLESLTQGAGPAAETSVEAQSTPSESKKAATGAIRFRVAALLFLSLTLHNLPEGLAVGISSLGSGNTDYTITIGIALHNIPEGMVVAIAVYGATNSMFRAMLMTFLSGIPEPLGALIAVCALRNVHDPERVDFLQMFVSGVMVYLSIAELLPEAVAKQRWLWSFFGLSVGVAVMLVTELVLHI